jgi:catechol 2,3-dioxygenase-like lactoylglutathione lyase family enzyme
MAAMSVRKIDHVYLETRSFEATVEFWQGLGFKLAATWGTDGHRAGRLESGDAYIVFAESAEPLLNVHFSLPDADAFAASRGLTVEKTHWGARLIQAKDPDGRTVVLEETT